MSDKAKKAGPPAIVLFGGSLAVVIALIAGMGYVFAPATGTLKTAIPADAGEGHVFELEDGSEFPGWGKIRIEGELLQIVRVDDKKGIVNSGARLREGDNQHRFMIQKRGLEDDEGNATPVYAHKAGKEVADTGTMFFPENNATYGDKVDDLFFLILIVTGIAFVLTEAFLVVLPAPLPGREPRRRRPGELLPRQPQARDLLDLRHRRVPALPGHRPVEAVDRDQGGHAGPAQDENTVVGAGRRPSVRVELPPRRPRQEVRHAGRHRVHRRALHPGGARRSASSSAHRTCSTASSCPTSASSRTWSRA